MLTDILWFTTTLIMLQREMSGVEVFKGLNEISPSVPSYSTQFMERKIIGFSNRKLVVWRRAKGADEQFNECIYGIFGRVWFIWLKYQNHKKSSVGRRRNINRIPFYWIVFYSHKGRAGTLKQWSVRFHFYFRVSVLKLRYFSVLVPVMDRDNVEIINILHKR